MLNSKRYILSNSRDMDIVTLARLHQKTKNENVPSIILSNYSQESAARRLTLEGNTSLTIERLNNNPKLLWEQEEEACRIKVI